MAKYSKGIRDSMVWVRRYSYIMKKTTTVFITLSSNLPHNKAQIIQCNKGKGKVVSS